MNKICLILALVFMGLASVPVVTIGVNWMCASFFCLILGMVLAKDKWS